MSQGTPHVANVPQSEQVRGCFKRRAFLLGALACGALLFGRADAAWADNAITRVEEDWLLEIGEPDPQTIAPQILNVISPTANMKGKYALFELNHRTCGDYGPGGMQLQVWDNESLRNFISPSNYSILSTSNETITYTVSMSLQFGLLRFEVKDGQSTTWGSFGGTSSLRLWTTTALQNLSTYDPAVSVANSDIGYASNRVVRFVLKEVRYYAGDDLIATDPTDRVAFERTP